MKLCYVYINGHLQKHLICVSLYQYFYSFFLWIIGKVFFWLLTVIIKYSQTYVNQPIKRIEKIGCLKQVVAKCRCGPRTSIEEWQTDRQTKWILFLPITVTSKYEWNGKYVEWLVQAMHTLPITGRWRRQPL